MLRRIQEQALTVHQLSAYAAQAQQQQQQHSSTRSESVQLDNWQQQQQQQQLRSTTVHDRWSSDWCKSVDDQLNNSSSSIERRVVNSSMRRADAIGVRDGDAGSVCSSSSSGSSSVSYDRASCVLPAEDVSMHSRHTNYHTAHVTTSTQQQQQQQPQHSSSSDVTRLRSAASALYESGVTDDDVYNNNNNTSHSRDDCNHQFSSSEHAHHWDVKQAKR
jgi:hypothetical protein